MEDQVDHTVKKRPRPDVAGAGLPLGPGLKDPIARHHASPIDASRFEDTAERDTFGGGLTEEPRLKVAKRDANGSTMARSQFHTSPRGSDALRAEGLPFTVHTTEPSASSVTGAADASQPHDNHVKAPTTSIGAARGDALLGGPAQAEHPAARRVPGAAAAPDLPHAKNDTLRQRYGTLARTAPEQVGGVRGSNGHLPAPLTARNTSLTQAGDRPKESAVLRSYVSFPPSLAQHDAQAAVLANAADGPHASDASRNRPKQRLKWGQGLNPRAQQSSAGADDVRALSSVRSLPADGIEGEASAGPGLASGRSLAAPQPEEGQAKDMIEAEIAQVTSLETQLEAERLAQVAELEQRQQALDDLAAKLASLQAPLPPLEEPVVSEEVDTESEEDEAGEAESLAAAAAAQASACAPPPPELAAALSLQATKDADAERREDAAAATQLGVDAPSVDLPEPVDNAEGRSACADGVDVKADESRPKERDGGDSPLLQQPDGSGSIPPQLPADAGSPGPDEPDEPDELVAPAPLSAAAPPCPAVLYDRHALLPQSGPARRILLANRLQAARANDALLANTPEWLVDQLALTTQQYLARGAVTVLTRPLSRAPSDAPGALEDQARHASVKGGLLAALRQHRMRIRQHEALLAERYMAERLHRSMLLEGRGLAVPMRRGALWGMNARSEYEQMQMMQQLRAMTHLEVPLTDQILCRWECLRSQFVNTNGLRDPVADLEEERHTRPWSEDEKKIFMDAFLVHSKEFSKIAECLPHRSTGDCIKWFYQNHLSEDFAQVRRKLQLRKRRSNADAKNKPSFGPLAVGPRSEASFPVRGRTRGASFAALETPSTRAGARGLMSQTRRATAAAAVDAGEPPFGGMPGKRRGPPRESDITEAFRRRGKDFDALAMDLSMSAAHVKAFYQKNRKRLELDKLCGMRDGLIARDAPPGGSAELRDGGLLQGSGSFGAAGSLSSLFLPPGQLADGSSLASPPLFQPSGDARQHRTFAQQIDALQQRVPWDVLASDSGLPDVSMSALGGSLSALGGSLSTLGASALGGLPGREHLEGSLPALHPGLDPTALADARPTRDAAAPVAVRPPSASGEAPAVQAAAVAGTQASPLPGPGAHVAALHQPDADGMLPRPPEAPAVARNANPASAPDGGEKGQLALGSAAAPTEGEHPPDSAPSASTSRPQLTIRPLGLSGVMPLAASQALPSHESAWNGFHPAGHLVPGLPGHLRGLEFPARQPPALDDRRGGAHLADGDGLNVQDLLGAGAFRDALALSPLLQPGLAPQPASSASQLKAQQEELHRIILAQAQAVAQLPQEPGSHGGSSFRPHVPSGQDQLPTIEQRLLMGLAQQSAGMNALYRSQYPHKP